ARGIAALRGRALHLYPFPQAGLGEVFRPRPRRYRGGDCRARAGAPRPRADARGAGGRSGEAHGLAQARRGFAAELGRALEAGRLPWADLLRPGRAAARALHAPRPFARAARGRIAARAFAPLPESI